MYRVARVTDLHASIGVSIPDIGHTRLPAQHMYSLAPSKVQICAINFVWLGLIISVFARAVFYVRCRSLRGLNV